MFKQKRSGWKVAEIALLVGVAISLLSGGLAMERQTALADKVVRLHVLAHSDAPEDQDLKLQVRDAVTVRTAALLETTADRAEAEALLLAHLSELQRVAEQTIAAADYSYSVKVELSETEFPTKAYDGFALPAGQYLALRVLIGEAAGQNWWCVVFPPLCTAAASDVAVTALASGFSEEEVRLITEQEGYVLKFKTVELWQKVRQMLEEMALV